MQTEDSNTMIQSSVAEVDPGSGALDPGREKNPEQDPGSGMTISNIFLRT
jgi:hypothetical protein